MASESMRVRAMIALALCNLVADTTLKLEDDRSSGDLLQDLLLRLEDLARELDSLPGSRGPEPRYPIIPDAARRLAELRS
jgi:hypothetical protein